MLAQYPQINQHDAPHKQNDKNHDNINRCRKKPFDKFQNPVGIERTFRNIIKIIYDHD